MNNMFGQVTWSLVDFEENEKMNPYTGWEENMNKVTSVPYTDIAVVFSRSTRDWSAKKHGQLSQRNNGNRSIPGFKAYTPHTFILDDAITSQDISRFRVLLAPGMDCISDAQESILKQFIFNGGTLLLTGESGVLTPYGEVRDKRAFCDILTERLLAETTKTDLMEVKYGKGRIIYSMDKSMMNEFCPSIRDTDMIYRFTPLIRK